MVEGAADPYAPGELLGGKYLVERQLGEGGMGRVLLAKHTELDRSVAVKLLRADLAADAVAVERFLREARAAARIVSEHVVHVFDVDRFDDGCPYIVMEYLEGEDLGRRLTRGALPVEEAVGYVLQACVGIAEAHRVGVVHRDLKPENLFLTRRRDGAPVVKVVDFGISKVSAQAGRREAKLTSGNLMGTPFYMSPEQLSEGDATDARSDVWALGIILFELVTAGAPFEAETLPALCMRILETPARRISEVRPDLHFPEGLEQVIDVCLAKDPASRYSGAVDLALVLAPFAPGSAASSHAASNLPTKPPVGPGEEALAGRAMPPIVRAVTAAEPEPFDLVVTQRPRRARWVPLAAAAGGVLLVGLIIVSFVRRETPSRAAEAPTQTAVAAPPIPSPPTSALLPPVASVAASSEAPPSALPSAAASTRPPPLVPATRPTATKTAGGGAPHDEFGGRR